MLYRIRTVKPDLFTHDELFEAEKETGLPLRLAFIGLFTVSDREGRFRWKPKQLKLAILPWDDVDMETVLDDLCRHGFVKRYVANDKEYGWIPTWLDHQRPRHDEAQSKIPPHPDDTRDEPVTDSLRPRNGPEVNLCSGSGSGSGSGSEEESGSKKPDTIPPTLYRQVIEDLNQRTGSKFRHTTRAYQKNIKARWNEGYRLPDFIQVNSNQCDQWLTDEKMCQYLTPDTLYRESKFPKYLNGPIQPKAQKWVPPEQRGGV